MAKSKNSYLGNIGRSIGFSIKNIGKDLAPAITDIANEQNQEFVSNIVSSIRDLKRGQNGLKKLIESNETSKGVKDALTGAMDDIVHGLKTGELYREHDYTDDFMKDMNFGDDDFGLSDDGEFNFDDLPDPDKLTPDAGVSRLESVTAEGAAASVEAINQGTKANVTLGLKNLNAMQGLAKAQSAHTGAMLSAFGKTNKATASGMMQMMTLQKTYSDQNLTALKSMNDNISNLVTFHNEKVASYFESTMKYQTGVLSALEKITNTLDRVYPEKEKYRSNYESDYEKAGIGYRRAMDLGGYMDVVKRNIMNNTLPGQMAGMFLENPAMLKEMLSNPLQTAMEYGMRSIMPKVLEESVKRLNDSFQNFIPAVLSKLGGYANDYNAPTWLQTLGQIFGIQNANTSARLGEYDKGPRPFDGITHRTINYVIPRYLAKMVQLLGGKEMIYSHQNGTWKDANLIKQDYESRLDAKKRYAGSTDLIHNMKSDDYRPADLDEAEKKRWNRFIDNMARNAATRQGFHNLRDKNVVKELFGKDADGLYAPEEMLTWFTKHIMNQRELQGQLIALAKANLEFNESLARDARQQQTEGDYSRNVALDNFEGTTSRQLDWNKMADDEHRLEQLTRTKDIAKNHMKEIQELKNKLKDEDTRLKHYGSDVVSSSQKNVFGGTDLLPVEKHLVEGNKVREDIKSDTASIVYMLNRLVRGGFGSGASNNGPVPPTPPGGSGNKQTPEERARFIMTRWLDKSKPALKADGKYAKELSKILKQMNPAEAKFLLQDFPEFADWEIGTESKKVTTISSPEAAAAAAAAKQAEKEAEKKIKVTEKQAALMKQALTANARKKGRLTLNNVRNDDAYDATIENVMERRKAYEDKEAEKARKERVKNGEELPEGEIEAGPLKTLKSMIQSPMKALATMFDKFDDAMFRLLFGSKDGEESLLTSFTKGVREGVSDVLKVLKDEFIEPFKKALFFYFTRGSIGDTISSFWGNLKKEVIGQKDEQRGIYVGGALSGVANTVTMSEDKAKAKQLKDELKGKTKADKNAEAKEVLRQINGYEPSEEEVKNYLKGGLGSVLKDEEKKTTAAFGSGLGFLKFIRGGRGKGKPVLTKFPDSTFGITNTSEYMDREGNVFPSIETFAKGRKVRRKDVKKIQENQQAEQEFAQSIANAVQTGVERGMGKLVDATKQGNNTLENIDKREEKQEKEKKEEKKQLEQETGIWANVKSRVNEMTTGIMDQFRSHLFGEDTVKTEDGKRRTVVDSVMAVFAKGANNFSNAFFGTNYDSDVAKKEYEKKFKAAIPRGIARGLVIGGGLGLASMAGPLGGFGILGSLFLPGGIVGSVILGLGAGLALESERFRTFLFGKQNDKGEYDGGIVPRNVVNFVQKNKRTLIGGGMLGLIQGITGVSILGSLLSLLPGGATVAALPALGIAGVGPVLFSMGAALAIKSEAFQEAFFGKLDPATNKKVGGLLQTRAGKLMKQYVPNAAFGALVGGIGTAALGQFGILGGLMLGPTTGALLGSAVGIGLAYDKFRNFLFGEKNEDGTFKSGGLIDRAQNFLTAEFFNPAKHFFKKQWIETKKWFSKSIIAPLAHAMTPYKIFVKNLFKKGSSYILNIVKGVGKAIYSVFKPLIDPLVSLGKMVAKGVKSLFGHVMNGVSGVLRSLISAPVALLTAPAKILGTYYRNFGTDEEKQAMQEADEAKEKRVLTADEEYKYQMGKLEEEIASDNAKRKEWRENGYNLNKDQLKIKNAARIEMITRLNTEQKDALKELNKTADLQAQDIALIRQKVAESFGQNGLKFEDKKFDEVIKAIKELDIGKINAKENEKYSEAITEGIGRVATAKSNVRKIINGNAVIDKIKSPKKLKGTIAKGKVKKLSEERRKLDPLEALNVLKNEGLAEGGRVDSPTLASNNERIGTDASGTSIVIPNNPLTSRNKDKEKQTRKDLFGSLGKVIGNTFAFHWNKKKKEEEEQRKAYSSTPHYRHSLLKENLNAESIVANRKEDAYRDKVLKALQGLKGAVNNQGKKEESLWDKLKSILGGGLSSLLEALGALGGIATLIGIGKKIYDWLTGNRGNDGDNGYHDTQLTEDILKNMAYSKPGQAAIHGARKLVPHLYNGAKGAVKGIYNFGKERVTRALDMNAIDKRATSGAQMAQHELRVSRLEEQLAEAGTEEESRAIKAELAAEKEAVEKLGQRKEIFANIKERGADFYNYSDIKNSNALQAKEKLQICANKLIQQIEQSSAFKKLAGGADRIKQFTGWIKAGLSKISEKVIEKASGTILEKIAKGLGKTVAAHATLGLTVVGFGIYDFYRGAENASSLFRVEPNQVTPDMTRVAALFNTFMGLPYVWVLDIILELAYAIGGADIKPFLVTTLYKFFGGEEDIDSMQKEYEKNFAQWSSKAWNAGKSKDDYDEERKKEEGSSAFANLMGKDSLAVKMLTRHKDEEGNQRHGLFSAVGDAWDNTSIPALIASGGTAVGVKAIKNVMFGSTNEKTGEYTKGVLTDTWLGQKWNNVFGTGQEEKAPINYSINSLSSKIALLKSIGIDTSIYSEEEIEAWDPNSNELPMGETMSEEQIKSREMAMECRKQIASTFGKVKPTDNDYNYKVALLKTIGIDPSSYLPNEINEWDIESGALPGGQLMTGFQSDALKKARQLRIDVARALQSSDYDLNSLKYKKAVLLMMGFDPNAFKDEDIDKWSIESDKLPTGEAMDQSMIRMMALIKEQRESLVQAADPSKFDLNGLEYKKSILSMMGISPEIYSDSAIAMWDISSGTLPDTSDMTDEQKAKIKAILNMDYVNTEEMAKSVQEANKGFLTRLKEGWDNNLAWLFGQNDWKTGEYQNGVFANMKKGLENNMAWLFGQNNWETGNYEVGAIEKAAVDFIWNVFGGENAITGEVQPNVATRFMERMNNEMAWLFGQNNWETGEYEKGVFARAKDSLQNEIDYFFGEFGEDGYYRSPFGQDLNNAWHNNLAWLFGQNSWETGEYEKGEIQKIGEGIVESWHSAGKAMDNELEYIFGTPDGKGGRKDNGLVDNFTAECKNTWKWLTNSISQTMTDVGKWFERTYYDLKNFSLKRIMKKALQDKSREDGWGAKISKQILQYFDEDVDTGDRSVADVNRTAPKPYKPYSSSYQPETGGAEGYGTKGGKGIQNNPLWANKPILPGNTSEGTIGESGCGLLAASDAINKVGGYVSPLDARKFVRSDDFALDGSGLTSKFIPKAINGMGGSILPVEPTPAGIAKALSTGMPLIAGGQSVDDSANSVFTRNGHYTTLQGGFIKNGEFYAYSDDPLGRPAPGQGYNVKQISMDILRGGPQMLGMVVPGGGNGVYNFYHRGHGGKNTMYMAAQSSDECTRQAASALWNAYTGESTTAGAFGSWYSQLLGMPATEYDFSASQQAEFNNVIGSHFAANPENPVYLYQTGGDGHGSHPLNRGSGNHATVIGRLLSNGNYEVYDSNGGVTHQLPLDQIFDPTATGSAKNNTDAHDANLVLIPDNPPSSPITNWSAQNGASDGSQSSGSESSATPNGKSGFGSSNSGATDPFGGIFTKVFGIGKNFLTAMLRNEKYTGQDYYGSSNSNGNKAAAPGGINNVALPPDNTGVPKGNIAVGAAKALGNSHPELFWAQMAHETGGFTSALTEEHNYGGLKYATHRIGEDSNRHSYFKDDADFLTDWVKDCLQYYPGLYTASTPSEWAEALKHRDDGAAYYTATVGEYTAGLDRWLNNSEYSSKLPNLKNYLGGAGLGRRKSNLSHLIPRGGKGKSMIYNPRDKHPIKPATVIPLTSHGGRGRRRGGRGYWDSFNDTFKNRFGKYLNNIPEDQKIKYELNPSEVAKKLNLTFDGFGNVEGVKIPDQYKILATDTDKIKYEKQAQQIFNYNNWDKIIPGADAIPSSTPSTVKYTPSTSLRTIPTSDADKLSGSLQNNSMINAINSLDNHDELRTIIEILASIAKKSGNLSPVEKALIAKTLNSNSAQETGGGGMKSSGNSGAGDTSKQGISGANSYQSTHQKNYKIASGEGYMGN